MNAVVDRTGAGITLEFWVDDYTKVSYSCLTVHYIKEEGLVKRFL